MNAPKMKRTLNASPEDVQRMLDTIWTFMSVSGLRIPDFVTIVRAAMPSYFKDDEADIEDIVGYIADCPAVGQPTQPIPAFTANGVNLVNEVMTASLNRLISRAL